MSSIQVTRGTFYRLLILIGIIAAIVWLPKILKPSAETVEAPVVTFAERPAPVPLKIVLSAPSAVCQRGQCVSAPNPPANSVTDGEWWYYYDKSPVTSDQLPEKVYLRRRNTKEKTETIMESSPLTSPRDLFMSPNGRHVAFWLDNIADPKLQLTELWVYDVEDGGIRLLAEKLYRPDVRSDVYWNSQATHLWLIADTGAQNMPNDQLELLRINAEAPGIAIAFSDVDWDSIIQDIADAAVDLSQHGDRLTYTTTNFLGSPILMVHAPDGKHRTSIRGEVKYTQWLEDDGLLYALQDKEGFTFWRVRDGVHRFIARHAGQLASARSDVNGQHIVFATANKENIELASLVINGGIVTREATVPDTGEEVTVAWVERIPVEAPVPSKGTAGGLDDAELAAFIENNFGAITDDPTGQPLRLIMTDEENVLFLDYRQTGSTERRLLIKVQDAINTEWSIRARYEPLNREWKKVQGGGLTDPEPARLYEWEQSLRQWILKENLAPS